MEKETKMASLGPTGEQQIKLEGGKKQGGVPHSEPKQG